MNAYELADYLDEFYKKYVPNDAFEESANMLRQQQAEIEELKEALSVKVILNEHAQQSMKEVKGLLRKAQEK